MPATKIGQRTITNSDILVANIRYYMSLMHMDNEDLAAVMGIDVTTVRRRFKRPRDFRQGELDRFARKAKIHIGDLYGRQEAGYETI